MVRRTGRKDAGRPRSNARLVYEDWIGGQHVRGYQVDGPDWSYITYVRAWTGSVLATRTVWREWWSDLMAEKKGIAHESFVQKALAGRSGTSKGAAASDSDLAAACPGLHEFLTLDVLPDGTPRTPSSLTLFTEGGLWKACLNERDAGLTLWATAESLQGLWDELEARLQAPAIDWRPSRRAGGSTQQNGVDKRGGKR